MLCCKTAEHFEAEGGESTYLMDAGDDYVAIVEEGLGAKDQMADGLTFCTNDLSCV